MKTLTFDDLRQANLSRCKKWHGEKGVDDWSLSDWGVAMGGEAGEALNVVKKMNRSRDGLTGNTETVPELEQALANELADTLIYLDLLAAKAGINLAQAVIDKFNFVSEREGFPERLPD